MGRAAGKSGIYIDGEWKSVEREQFKRAVQERTIRLIVATDAACEGLNLQTLGTLINVDLPWNPSRLEQRIGRIKRFGQRRDRVDMLNLLYHGSAQPTVAEKVYAKLSCRMKDRFDIFGTLPDVIDDDWIDDQEKLEEELKNYTNRRAQANAFDLRYAGDVVPKDERWELCEKVLARRQEAAVAGVGRAPLAWPRSTRRPDCSEMGAAHAYAGAPIGRDEYYCEEIAIAADSAARSSSSTAGAPRSMNIGAD